GAGHVALTTSVKVMPKPLGDYDYLPPEDYPADALRDGVQGDVVVRVLVGEDGRVARTELRRGLGHGLDEKALELAGKLRFKPALDDADRPVATWIPWTFHFKAPK